MHPNSWGLVYGEGGAPGTVPLHNLRVTSHVLHLLGAPQVVPSTSRLTYFWAFLGALGRGEGAPLVRYLCKTQKSLHGRHVWETLIFFRTQKFPILQPIRFDTPLGASKETPKQVPKQTSTRGNPHQLRRNLNASISLVSAASVFRGIYIYIYCYNAPYRVIPFPKWCDALLAHSFTLAHLCDSPFCNTSRNKLIFRRVKSTPEPNSFEKYRDAPRISIAILLQKYAPSCWK